MNKVKRLLAVMLVMTMMLSLCSTSVLAADRGGKSWGWTRSDEDRNTEENPDADEACVEVEAREDIEQMYRPALETPEAEEVAEESEDPFVPEGEEDPAAPEEGEEFIAPEESEDPEAAEKEEDPAAPEEGEEFIVPEEGEDPAVPEENPAAPEEDEEMSVAEYPAVPFESEKIDGVTVFVDAPEGALPKGTTMKVEKVSLDAVQDAVDKAEDISGTVVAAVDITFFDADGKPVEPEKDITVTMTSEEIAKVEAPEVVHVDVKAEEIIEADVAAEPVEQVEEPSADDEVVFEAKNFSVYAVVAPNSDEEARVTVNFYNGETIVATVYVKNSDVMLGDGERQDNVSYIEDIVYDPGVGGSLEKGRLFQGWSLDVDGLTNKPAGEYAGAEYTTETTPMTIPQIRKLLEDLEIVEGDVLNIYAMVFNVFNVTYEDEQGITLASADILCSITETSAPYTINETYTHTDDTHSFKGWNVKEGADNISNAKYTQEEVTTDAEPPYKQGTTMDIAGDVIFSVNVAEGHWLVFEENGYGATYNAPVFVEEGQKASDVRPDMSLEENMHRAGYTFLGWFLSDPAPAQEGDDPTGAEYDFDQELADKVTVYAKWQVASNTKYTLIVWRQSVADDKDAADAEKTYDFAFAEEKENVTSLTDVSALDLSEYQGLDGESITVDGKTFSFFGFKYNSTMTAKADSDNVTIGNGVVANKEKVDPNGTTVVNLYYDRELVTYNYRVNSTVYTYTPTTRTTDGAYYWIPDGSGGYERVYLYYNNGQYYRDRNNGGCGQPTTYSNPYDGTPYDQNSSTGWNIVETQTGLYEQKLSKYGYEWPTTYQWRTAPNATSYSSIEDIFQDSQNETPESAFVTNWYGHDVNYNSYVYHYLQNPDGSWPNTATYTVQTGSGNGMTFRSFQGFKPLEFRMHLPNGVNIYYTGTAYSGNNLVNPTSHTAVNGWTDWLPYGTGVEFSGNSYHEIGKYTAGRGLEFRYARNQYDLTYMVGRFVDKDNKALTPPITGELKQESDIAFESSMAAYSKTGNKYYNPDTTTVESENYLQKDFVFVGWFVDETCTTPAEFDGTLPMNGMSVYGKWQQKEYRVFLHPQAGTDPTLTWGSETQQMNFRVSYNEKISVPTGLRTGYEFLGWYTNEAGTKAYASDTKLTDTTVPATPAYDKTVDMTENADGTQMDKWGNLNPGAVNKDVDRPWIERKLDLYAKWSKVLVGASGIGVIYDPNGGSPAPTDIRLYKDNVYAVAQAAPSTPPANDKQFLYWVVQKWNGTKFTDLTGDGSIVYPGEIFLVLKDNAHDVDLGGGSHEYTIQLRAEWGDKEAAKDTHIEWFRNWSSDDDEQTGLIHQDKDLQINQAVDIYTLSADIPTRTGYKFLGWAREAEKTEQGATVFYYELDESDVYLKWVEASQEGENTVAAHYELADGTTVTQVAADEVLPYQAMYAVWEAQYFYVYHSGTGKLEAVPMDTIYDLSAPAHLSENTLYGGWFTDCGAVTAENIETAKAAAESAEGFMADVTGAEAYDGSALKTKAGVKFWERTKAGKTPGNELEPVADTVYYVKEVPNIYLNTNARWVYDTADKNKIISIYLITVVDDTLYKKDGFEVDGTPVTGDLASKFSYQQRNSDVSPDVVTPKSLISQRGYLSIATIDDSIASILAATEDNSVSINPFWETLDGVTVRTTSYGLYCNEENAEALTKDNIAYK